MTGENFRRNESSNDSSEQGTRPVYGDGELGPVGDRWRVRGTLRFEIEPDGAGTRFTLSNVFDDIGKAARDAAGWHSCLDALERELDGAPAPAAIAPRTMGTTQPRLCGPLRTGSVDDRTAARTSV